VHIDNDGDCKFTPGDAPLSGVVIQLRDATGNVIRTTVTDANGTYRFDDLVAGTYTVFEVQPSGYLDGGESIGTAGGIVSSNDTISSIQLVGGTLGENYNFCEKLPSSIRGYVHADVDGDCVFDPQEKPIANVIIQLLDASGKVLQTTTTDAAGHYAFENLAAGEYQIREIQPDGYFDSGDHPGSEGGVVLENDLISQIILGPGKNAVEYHFCEIPPAMLCGYVFHDANNNGVLDAGEQGIAGVSVALLDASGVYTGKTEITDANGRYCFETLRPGIYSVQEVQPVGWIDGLDTAGTAGGTAQNPGDIIVGALLKPNQHADQYNFGELLPASIHGRVHADTNGNCEFDPGEKPLAGVKIELYNASGTLIATTTTDTHGEYEFNGLTPGSYTIHEVQPGGYFDGGQNAGSAGGVVSDDTISEIALGSGTNATEYDFCEKPPASISGYVFQDGPAIPTTGSQTPNVPAVRDGVLTPDDKRLAGIVLELRDGITGEPILGSATLGGKYAPNQIVTVTTDENGYYEFSGLKAGTYAVFQQQDPSGYLDGINTAGSTGGIVMSAYTQADQNTLDQLKALPASGDAILKIVVGAGAASTSNNFSEVATRQSIIIFPPPAESVPQSTPQNVWLLPETRFTPVDTPPLEVPKFLYGGSTLNNTWHLSILDGGNPRGPEVVDAAIQEAALNEEATDWKSAGLKKSKWTITTRGADGKLTPGRETLFGMIDGVAITGDFDGDGTTEMGVFKDGEWFIDLNGNGEWDEEDLWAKLGKRDDKPVTGDWNGDGKTDIGIYGPAWARDPHAIKHEPGLPDQANQTRDARKNHPPRKDQAAIGERALKLTVDGKTREDLIDHVFHYGTAQDIPITGDWNGDGIDTIGIFHAGKWYRDTDGDGRYSLADRPANFGGANDTPVPGDWNGDGRTQLGIYREGAFYLDTNGNEVLDAEDEVVRMGAPNDRPIVGDFDGDGRDEVGIVQNGKVIHGDQVAQLRKVR
jgi:protocatechuate 3,4-dioxygenase beta subunit